MATKICEKQDSGDVEHFRNLLKLQSQEEGFTDLVLKLSNFAKIPVHSIVLRKFMQNNSKPDEPLVEIQFPPERRFRLDVINQVVRFLYLGEAICSKEIQGEFKDVLIWLHADTKDNNNLAIDQMVSSTENLTEAQITKLKTYRLRFSQYGKDYFLDWEGKRTAAPPASPKVKRRSKVLDNPVKGCLEGSKLYTNSADEENQEMPRKRHKRLTKGLPIENPERSSGNAKAGDYCGLCKEFFHKTISTGKGIFKHFDKKHDIKDGVHYKIHPGPECRMCDNNSSKSPVPHETHSPGAFLMNILDCKSYQTLVQGTCPQPNLINYSDFKKFKPNPNSPHGWNQTSSTTADRFLALN